MFAIRILKINIDIVMSDFVNKIKTLLSNVLLKEAKIGDLLNGNNGGATIIPNKGKTRQLKQRDVNPLASEILKRLLATRSRGSYDENDIDPNWRSSVWKFSFPQLKKLSKTSEDIDMVLTEQTGRFLQNLFNTLLGLSDDGTETEEGPTKKLPIDEIRFSFKRIEKNNSFAIDNIKESIATLGDNTFNDRCKMFMDFIEHDKRFFPDSYVITLDVPIESYNQDDIDKICGRFDISANELRITTATTPKYINIKLTINCNSTLFNIYCYSNFFRVGTNKSSLQKYAWLTKSIRDIFIRNSKKTSEEEKVNNHKFINAMPGGITYDEEALFGLMQRENTGQSVFCFIDENNESYIYLPGTDTTEDNLLVIDDPNPNGDYIDKIHEQILKYVEGFISERDMRKALGKALPTSGKEAQETQSEKKYTKTNDEIEKKFWSDINLDTPLNDIKESILEILRTELGNANDPKYENLLKLFDSDVATAIERLSANKQDTNYDERVSDFKNMFKDEMGKLKTSDYRSLRTIVNKLISRNTTIYVFKFMYSDSIDASYSIDLPSDLASDILDKYQLGDIKSSPVPLDKIYVPGSENLPRKVTTLSKKVEPGLSGIQYVLSTTSKDMIYTPVGSMYGVVYENKLVPEDFRVAAYIQDIVEMRSMLGKLISMYYVEVQGEDLKKLENGETVFIEQEAGSFSLDSSESIMLDPNDASVQYALRSLRGRDRTLILRPARAQIINYSSGAGRNTTNDEIVDITFSDYFDGVVNMRQQLEQFMLENKIGSNETKKLIYSKKTAALSRLAGKPTVVKRFINNMVGDIEGGSQHSVLFNEILSSCLSEQKLPEKIFAYISYLQGALGGESESSQKKKKKKKIPVSVKLDFTPVKDVNFAGDRIFVNGDRNAWLLDDKNAVIPFYEKFKDGTLNDDVKLHLQSLDETAEKTIESYYDLICQLCDCTMNMEKVMITDGVYARIYSKKTGRISSAMPSAINTNIDTIEFDDGKDLGDEATSFERTIKSAPASDINDGFIISPFIKRHFRPISDSIKEAIRMYKTRTEQKSIAAIARTGSSAVVPNCPYHTIIWACDKDGFIQINILSSIINVPELKGSGVFEYDKDRGFVVNPTMVDSLMSDSFIKESVLKRTANQDIMYCIASVSTRNYFYDLIIDALEKYETIARDLYDSFDELIMSVGSTPDGKKNMEDYINRMRTDTTTPKAEIVADIADYIINNTYYNNILSNLDSLLTYFKMIYLISNV